jgi:hypothetical protein
MGFTGGLRRWALLHAVFTALAPVSGQIDTAMAQHLANQVSRKLAADFRSLNHDVTQAHVLQAVLDGPTVGAQAQSYSLPGLLMRQQAGQVAEGLVASARSLLELRDATTQAQATAGANSAEQQRKEAEAVMLDSNDRIQALQDLGVDADRLTRAGILREASLEADVQAIDPAVLPPAGSLWTSQADRTVSVAGSVVTLPQYCLRIGIPSFGLAYTAAYHRGNIAEGVLGGLAPRPNEGQYPCVTRQGNLEQQSLDSSFSIQCLTRVNARVLTCGATGELVDTVRFLNATATLDSTLRSLLAVHASAGLLWQRIAHSRMGVERSFPAMLWKEGSTDAYERYDPRLQPWFWAAASAPRALVVVLDTGAAMEEFDRRDIALRVVSAVLRSVGPADLVALIAARDGAPRVFGCASIGSRCGSASEAVDGLRMCAHRNQTVEWMLAGANSSFLVSSFGLCNLGEGVELALQLMKAEMDAWESHAGKPGSLAWGTQAPALSLGFPKPEVLVVASAHGWAPSNAVQARAAELGVALHAVSVGALGSDYERAWFKRLACTGSSAPGAFSHIPYRYIWQQVVGGWYRLTARRFVDNERLVSVSALRLAASKSMPVLTLSAPYFEPASPPASEASPRPVSGVVAMDVAPGPVVAQLAQNLLETLTARMAGAPGIMWWEAQAVQRRAFVEMWLVDSSGIVLAHPALPSSKHGFTTLRALEGLDVQESIMGLWDAHGLGSAAVLQDADCVGPVVLNSNFILQGSTWWRVGRAAQRAVLVAKVGGLVEHLDAMLVIVLSGNGESVTMSVRARVAPSSNRTMSLMERANSFLCGRPSPEQDIVLTRLQPGFPIASAPLSLVHHSELAITAIMTGSGPGSWVDKAHDKLSHVTVASSVYAVSAIGKSTRSSPGATTTASAPSAATDAEKQSALEALRSWLLVATLDSAGRLTPPAPASVHEGGYVERAVRDILATSRLDGAWKQAWTRRQQLASTDSASTSLPALWRFVTAMTESGVMRIFPGCTLPGNVNWTQSETYMRGMETAGVEESVVAVAGPYAHPIDGTKTISMGSVVWEASAHKSIPAGIVAVEFTYASFVLGTLDAMDECKYLGRTGRGRWCMLLDRHASLVGISSGKKTAVPADAGAFLGEVEPMLTRDMLAAGLLVLVQAPERFASGRQGTVLSIVELLVDASYGVTVHSESWDGDACIDSVLFAFRPVSGTNMVVVLADKVDRGPVACASSPIKSWPPPQMSPLTREVVVANLTSASSPSLHNVSQSQCGVTRSSPCASCHLLVESLGSRGRISRAGERVVGSDSTQWERQVNAEDDGGGGDGCVMPSPTLVHAHDGAAGDSSSCVWWRRRAGWC